MISEPWYSHIGLKEIMARDSFVQPEYKGNPGMLKAINENVEMLVVGAGGLGCETLKNLVLMGVLHITCIDLDTISLTNLNRQFLFRQKDIGRYKSDVAAEYIMNKYPGVKIESIHKNIKELPITFYKKFNVIIAGLDNIDARRWLNSLVHSIVEFDASGKPNLESVIPMIDGGSEEFRGQARVIIPYQTDCYECTIDSIAQGNTYPMCTLAENPRLPEHCIEYAYIFLWEKSFPKVKVNKDSAKDITWIYEKAKERAEKYHIEGVTYNLTLGVVKRVIPAVASTNAIISASCALEAVKILPKFTTCLNNYMLYNGRCGAVADELFNEKKEDCMICSAIEKELKISGDLTLSDMLNELDTQFKLNNPSILGDAGQIYDANPLFVKDYQGNVSKTLFDLVKEKCITNPDHLNVKVKTFPVARRIKLVIT